jgi:hypothetical protein
VQVPTKYHSKTVTIPMEDRTFTIENRTPILSAEDRERRKKEIEKRLFNVFRKYVPKNMRQ